MKRPKEFQNHLSKGKNYFFKNLSHRTHSQAICVFCNLNLCQSIKCKDQKIIVQQNPHLKFCSNLYIRNKGRNDQNELHPLMDLKIFQLVFFQVCWLKEKIQHISVLFPESDLEYKWILMVYSGSHYNISFYHGL